MILRMERVSSDSYNFHQLTVAYKFSSLRVYRYIPVVFVVLSSSRSYSRVKKVMTYNHRVEKQLIKRRFSKESWQKLLSEPRLPSPRVSTTFSPSLCQRFSFFL